MKISVPSFYKNSNIWTIKVDGKEVVRASQLNARLLKVRIFHFSHRVSAQAGGKIYNLEKTKEIIDAAYASLVAGEPLETVQAQTVSSRRAVKGSFKSLNFSLIQIKHILVSILFGVQ